jgi:hypothetical protein
MSNLLTLNNAENPQLSVLNQNKAHESRSKKYNVIQTENVIEEFEKLGFSSTLVAQENSTKKYKGYGTHLLKFTHDALSFGDPILDAEMKPVLYFKNSHHGRTRAVFDLGLFRMYCLNGIVLGSSIKSMSLRHMGISKNDISTVIDEMREAFKYQVKDLVLELKETQLGRTQQLAYAQMAFNERVRSNSNIIEGSGNFTELLRTHRSEDDGNSAWVVFNKIQENLGLNNRQRPEGVSLSYNFMGKDKEGNEIEKTRNLSSELKSIKEVQHLNKFLFNTIQTYLPSHSAKQTVETNIAA